MALKRRTLHKGASKLKNAFNFAAHFSPSKSSASEDQSRSASKGSRFKMAVSKSKSSFKRTLMRKRLKSFLKTADLGAPDRTELFPAIFKAEKADNSAKYVGKNGISREKGVILSESVEKSVVWSEKSVFSGKSGEKSVISEKKNKT